MTEYDGAERTTTDILRQLLDERGVEWMPSAWSANDETFYKVGEVGYLATELSSGRMKVCIEGYPTPEQAVEATLGRGTCKVEGSIDYGEFGCWQYDLSCGCRILWPDSEPPRFCPECGRRVEP